MTLPFLRSWRAGFFAFACTACLGGCSTFGRSEEVPPPVGIGTEIDQLKRSPCACLELPQIYHQIDQGPQFTLQTQG